MCSGIPIIGGITAYYYGYTTIKLSTRIKKHRYSQSSIYKHFTIYHDKIPPTYDILKDMFKVIYQRPDTRNVQIAEAILAVQNQYMHATI